MKNAFCCTLILAGLTACLPDDSKHTSTENSPTDGSGTPIIKTLDAPAVVSISQDESSITLNWDTVDGAFSYDLYWSSDPDFDFSSYAAFDKGNWTQNVSSPYTTILPRRAMHYYLGVVALNDDTESPMSDLVPITTRYSVSDDGQQVTDIANNLVWSRCPIGMSWSNQEASCFGSATELNFSEGVSALDGTNYRMPTITELISLSYCATGNPRYYFDDEFVFGHEQENMSCKGFDGLSPGDDLAKVNPLFSNGLPVDRAYMTSDDYYSIEAGMQIIRLFSLEQGWQSSGTNKYAEWLSVFLLPVRNL